MPRALDVSLYAFVYAAQNFIKNPKILGAGKLNVWYVQGFWKSVIFANSCVARTRRIFIRLRLRGAKLHQKSQNTWCGQAEREARTVPSYLARQSGRKARSIRFFKHYKQKVGCRDLRQPIIKIKSRGARRVLAVVRRKICRTVCG